MDVKLSYWYQNAVILNYWPLGAINNSNEIFKVALRLLVRPSIIALFSNSYKVNWKYFLPVQLFNNSQSHVWSPVIPFPSASFADEEWKIFFMDFFLAKHCPLTILMTPQVAFHSWERNYRLKWREKSASNMWFQILEFFFRAIWIICCAKINDFLVRDHKVISSIEIIFLRLFLASFDKIVNKLEDLFEFWLQNVFIICRLNAVSAKSACSWWGGIRELKRCIN